MKTGKEVKVALGAPIKYLKRQYNESDPGPYRNEFHRDRDRLLYSKEFRRLSGKTQVFLPTSSDHVRTRLTHTLEVSQIARVSADNLKLDKNLCEAIAFGHDVGHTPFGHVGEKTLNFIMNGCDKLILHQNEMSNSKKGFKHNLQGLRVTCDLERLYGRVGLNLSNFTLWGIKNHTGSTPKQCGYLHAENCFLKREQKKCHIEDGVTYEFYDKYEDYLVKKKGLGQAWSFEGFIVKMADEIAQRHHDIEDAIIMNIIDEDEIVGKLKEFFSDCFDDDDREILKNLDCKSHREVFLGYVSKFIVHFLNKNLISNSIDNLNDFINDFKIKCPNDFEEAYHGLKEDDVKKIICYSDNIRGGDEKLHKFLKNRVLNSYQAQRMDGRGRFIIKRLFKAYLTNPRQLHDSTIVFVERILGNIGPDFIPLSKEQIGDLRNNIDLASNKDDPNFMIALLRGVCDHVAGMTDRFAIEEYKRLYS